MGDLGPRFLDPAFLNEHRRYYHLLYRALYPRLVSRISSVIISVSCLDHQYPGSSIFDERARAPPLSPARRLHSLSSSPAYSKTFSLTSRTAFMRSDVQRRFPIPVSAPKAPPVPIKSRTHITTHAIGNCARARKRIYASFALNAYLPIYPCAALSYVRRKYNPARREGYSVDTYLLDRTRLLICSRALPLQKRTPLSRNAHSYSRRAKHTTSPVSRSRACSYLSTENENGSTHHHPRRRVNGMVRSRQPSMRCARHELLGIAHRRWDQRGVRGMRC